MSIRRSVRARRFYAPPILTIACLALGFLAGCAGHASQRPPVVAASVAQTHSDPLSVLRTSALYVEAQRDCRTGRYVQAADALGRLGRTPGLTPDQISFCRAQQAICLRDAGKPVPSMRLASYAAPTVPTTPLAPEQSDCGPRALVLACDSMGVRGADLAALRRVAGTTGRGTTLAGLASAARSVGLKARGEQVDLAALRRLSGPALAWVDGDHYLAVLSVDGDTATVHDPNSKREEDIPTGALLARSGGILLALRR